MPRNFIIGGGLSGLIAGYYLPEFTIISPDYGGMHGASFPLGPQFLYHTLESDAFLTGLDMPIFPRQVKVGYYFKNRFVEPNEHFLQMYSQKVRSGQQTLDAMSGMKTSFDILEVDWTHLIEVLRPKVNIISGEVDKVFPDTHRLRLVDGRAFVYDYLISTVPLPILQRILFKWFPLKYAGVLFELELDLWYYLQAKDFDYVYFPDPEVPYYRKTQVEDPFVVVESITTSPTVKEEKDRTIFLPKVNQYWLPYGKIISGSTLEFAQDLKEHEIYLLGRYGKWVPGYKLHDLVAEVQHWKKCGVGS